MLQSAYYLRMKSSPSEESRFRTPRGSNPVGPATIQLLMSARLSSATLSARANDTRLKPLLRLARCGRLGREFRELLATEGRSCKAPAALSRFSEQNPRAAGLGRIA
jgi:hypothetical protein